MGKYARERLEATNKRDKGEENKEVNEIEEVNEEEVKEESLREEKDDNEDDLVKEDEDDYDNFEESTINLKKLIVVLLVVIISLSIILVLWCNSYKIVENVFNSNTKVTEEKSNENENKNENVAVASVDLSEIYDKVHLMANTIIIAEDGQVWGKCEINKENLTEIRNNLLNNDEYLYNELSKWLELDFSNAVEVHNYVWEKLGGTVGKAKELDEEKIQEVIKQLSE